MAQGDGVRLVGQLKGERELVYGGDADALGVAVALGVGDADGVVVAVPVGVVPDVEAGLGGMISFIPTRIVASGRLFACSMATT